MVNDPGLVDYLLGNVDTANVLKYNDQAKMWVLAAGCKTRNPADLLGSDRMKEFMTVCKR